MNPDMTVEKNRNPTASRATIGSRQIHPLTWMNETITTCCCSLSLHLSLSLFFFYHQTNNKTDHRYHFPLYSAQSSPIFCNHSWVSFFFNPFPFLSGFTFFSGQQLI